MTEVEEETAEVDLTPRLILPLLSIRVHTINLDDRGALCQVGSDDDLRRVSHQRIMSSPARCEPEQS
jgi:hypothetical protein